MRVLIQLLFLTVLFSCTVLPFQAIAATVVIQPEDGIDTQLVNDYRADWNYGSYSDLITNWGNNLRSIGLLRFDLSSIDAGSQVNSAVLDLYHETNFNMGQTYSIFRVTEDWDENTVTFNTAPSFDPTAVSSLTISDYNEGLFRSWDITSLVDGWVNGAYENYGLWIEEIPVQGSATAYFASSDYRGASTDPRLTVDHNPVPVPASIILLGFGLLGLVGVKRGKK